MKVPQALFRTIVWFSIGLAIMYDAPPVLAADGKKYFKEGIRFAGNRQWDKAAERLALAVSEEPSNAEYHLNLQRALVNAAIMLIERGDRLAAQKDYDSAYNAYRQAYAFDNTNAVALVKMRRMLEAQGIPAGPDLPAGEGAAHAASAGEAGVRPASASIGINPGADPAARPGGEQARPPRPATPVHVPVRTDVVFHGTNLLTVIEQLAQTVRLNVAVDQPLEATLRSRNVNIELRDVTATEALETILQINSLTYVQRGARTIIITLDNSTNRMRFEPMSVQAFYLKNTDAGEMKNAVSSIGAKQVVVSKQQNALVARDTKANLEMMKSFITWLDKSKAEVLIDVSLYEVSQSDLLQIGNQFAASGSGVTLSDPGGINRATKTLIEHALRGPGGIVIGLPPSTLTFFESRGKAKLLASTQVHVLDNEQQQTRIGQRVPVKTGATPVPNVGSAGTGGSTAFTTVDNIQYEDVGLNIDVQPQVFDDEVLVKMKIESSSVDRSAGDFLTPSFNRRSLSSVARMKDGQTTMIAGVSRTDDSRGFSGIPLIGLIPILGRFFATPSSNRQQSDVVITVTPHILRRPDLTDDDRLARDAGRGTEATRQVSLQEIVDRAVEEGTSRAPIAEGTQTERTPDSARGPLVSSSSDTPASGVVKTSLYERASARSGVAPDIVRRAVDRPGQANTEPAAENQIREPVSVTIRAAQAVSSSLNFYAAVNLNGDAKVSGAEISLDFDPAIFEVKTVRNGGLLPGAPVYSVADGRLTISLKVPDGNDPVTARGQLVIIAFSIRGKGQTVLTLNSLSEVFAPGGGNLPLSFQNAAVEVK